MFDLTAFADFLASPQGRGAFEAFLMGRMEQEAPMAETPTKTRGHRGGRKHNRAAKRERAERAAIIAAESKPVPPTRTDLDQMTGRAQPPEPIRQYKARQAAAPKAPAKPKTATKAHVSDDWKAKLAVIKSKYPHDDFSWLKEIKVGPKGGLLTTDRPALICTYKGGEFAYVNEVASRFAWAETKERELANA